MQTTVTAYSKSEQLLLRSFAGQLVSWSVCVRVDIPPVASCKLTTAITNFKYLHQSAWGQPCCRQLGDLDEMLLRIEDKHPGRVL